MSILSTKRPRLSAWQFVTFGSGGIGLAFVVAGGGQVVLKDPSYADQTFTYGGVGLGLSAGLKIPKIGKIKIPAPKGTATGGPKSFPSRGTVFALDGSNDGELTKADIQGLCMYTEVGGGLIAGASGTALFVGLNPVYLALLSIPGAQQLFINSAKGLIAMAGVNVGVQAGGGASVSLGYLR